MVNFTSDFGILIFVPLLVNLYVLVLRGTLNKLEVIIGTINIITVMTEVAQSALWLLKNILKASLGLKCSYTDKNNFNPRKPITQKAAGSKKG